LLQRPPLHQRIAFLPLLGAKQMDPLMDSADQRGALDFGSGGSKAGRRSPMPTHRGSLLLPSG